MDTLTRRRFLLATGVVGAAALAAGAGAYTLARHPRHGQLARPAAGRRDDAGAGHPVRRQRRPQHRHPVRATRPTTTPAPSWRTPPEEVLRPGRPLGLNPALKGLHALWDAKQLAIVRGVGYPKPDRSHFRSMDIWQTAQPDRPATPAGSAAGWTPPAATRGCAVSFEPVLPPLLAGATSAGAAVPLTGSRPPTGPLAAGAAAFGAAVRRRAGARPGPRRAFADLVSVDADDPASARLRTPTTEDAGRRPPAHRHRRAGRTGRAARPGRAVRRGGRADPGLLGVARRLRHPRRREAAQARLLDQLDTARHRVPRPDGGDRARAEGRRRGLLRVRPAGRGQRLPGHRPRHRRTDVRRRRHGPRPGSTATSRGPAVVVGALAAGIRSRRPPWSPARSLSISEEPGDREVEPAEQPDSIGQADRVDLGRELAGQPALSAEGVMDNPLRASRAPENTAVADGRVPVDLAAWPGSAGRPRRRARHRSARWHSSSRQAGCL